MPKDITLTCRDCGSTFVVLGDDSFFALKEEWSVCPGACTDRLLIRIFDESPSEEIDWEALSRRVPTQLNLFPEELP